VTAIAGNTLTLSRTTGAIAAGTVRDTVSTLQIGASGITLAADTPNVANTITAPIVLGANQEWNNNAARILQLQGSIYLDNYTLTLKGVASSAINFNGANTTQSIGGTGNIVIDTDGSVSFGSGSGGRQQNSYTGGVTLNKGTLVVQGGNSGGTEAASVLGTGVLTINGGSINGGSNIAGHALLNSGQVWNSDWTYLGSKALDMGTGQITLGTAAGTSRTLTVNNQVLTLGGAIVNGTTANSLIKAGGAGTLTLTGASTYTGSTTIQAGTLRISGADDRLPTGTTLTIDGGATAGGTFDLNGRNQTVAGLSGGSGTVKGLVTNTLAATTRTITVTGSSTFDGIIQNGALTALTALTKSTGGTLTLTGVNTYTGDTTVSAGALLLADDAGLKFTISSNGVNNKITGAGTVSLDGDFTFDLTGASSTLGDIWNIVNVSTLTETFGSTFTVSSTLDEFTDLGSGLWSITENSATYQFSTVTGDLQVVPEPGTLVMLLGGLGMLVGFQRSRRRL
jgi:autotransporter-associated beta strand protein